MVYRVWCFHSYDMQKGMVWYGTHIYLGYDGSHDIKGYGDVCVTLPNGNVRQIQNVMYVQDESNFCVHHCISKSQSWNLEITLNC